MLTSFPCCVSSCNSFSPTDNKFATCSDDGTVRIWDFLRCHEERILRGMCTNSTHWNIYIGRDLWLNHNTTILAYISIQFSHIYTVVGSLKKPKPSDSKSRCRFLLFISYLNSLSYKLNIGVFLSLIPFPQLLMCMHFLGLYSFSCLVPWIPFSKIHYNFI